MTIEMPWWWGKCEYCHKKIPSGIGTICNECVSEIRNPKISPEEERLARIKMKEFQRIRDNTKYSR